MARPSTGQVVTRELFNGLTSYSLRFVADGKRRRVYLGTDEGGWTPQRADKELATVLALVSAGAWRPEEPSAPTTSPTFHEYATSYLAGRRGELRANTYADYTWRLVCHLLPFFADHEVGAIDIRLVDRYRQHKIAEREQVKALEGGRNAVRDSRGQRVRPLSNESINKTLALLATILDVAIDHGLLVSNPARGRRRRLKAARPRRPFLEKDEVKSLLVAAEQLDRRPGRAGAKADQVRVLREAGSTYAEIGAAVGVSLSHAHYLYGRATQECPEPVLVRRAIVATLVGAGLRVTELCELRWRDVDLKHGRIAVRDAKTPAGLREVRITPWLLAELDAHRARLRAVGRDTGAASPTFPTSAGGFRDRKNVCDRVVKKCVVLADQMREAASDPSIPEGITPHALRCTYISLLLEAGAPLPYVMAQVGHSDESTTLGIYARVLTRQSRASLDGAFDQGLMS